VHEKKGETSSNEQLRERGNKGRRKSVVVIGQMNQKELEKRKYTAAGGKRERNSTSNWGLLHHLEWGGEK